MTNATIRKIAHCAELAMAKALYYFRALAMSCRDGVRGHPTKGQIISKCFFGVFNFFQKTNENTSHSSKNEFISSFFGRIQGLIICFRN